MKICLAQTRPVTGDIEANLARHEKFIEQALMYGSDMILFSELSLTGYEPGLAKELAIAIDDSRLDKLQQLSDRHRLLIGVGAPIRVDDDVTIGLLVFRPHEDRLLYSKRYLHPDEEPYFVSGENFPVLKIQEKNIALAICYEIAVPNHAQCAHDHGAEIYLASVAKFENGIENAGIRLSEIARQYSIPVLMVNAIGQADNGTCAGKSSVFDGKGKLVGQLDDQKEGLLVYDTESHEVRKIYL